MVLDQAGFRRRFRITPCKGAVQAEVEDDFHCMSVVLRHDNEVATEIEPDLRRAPWTTCPGAESKLVATFKGRALSAFSEQGQKQSNCTHLYDLAQLAAKHAFDKAPLVYDIAVSDPVDDQRIAEIYRNGELQLTWIESKYHIVEPTDIAGLRLDKLRGWIETLNPALQEAAKLLQWGNILANGRVIPLEQQSDASKMPPNCHTLQPQQAVLAKRVGEIKDFSPGADQPLGEYEPVIQ